MKEVEVDTTYGKFRIRSPLAEERNNALIKASENRDKPNETVFITELLPLCINSHPFDHKVPLLTRLNKMECDEWDKLAAALIDLGKQKDDVTVKKLEQPSNQNTKSS